MFKFLIRNRKEKLAKILADDAERRRSIIDKVKIRLELELIDWVDEIQVECWKGKELGYSVKDVFLIKTKLKDFDNGVEYVPISASPEYNVPTIIINQLNNLFMWNNGFGKFSPGNKAINFPNMYYIEFWPEDQDFYDNKFNKLVKKYS